MDNKEKSRRIENIIHSGMAANTISTYERDLKYFWGWAKYAMGENENYPAAVDLVELFALDHIQGLPEKVEAELIANRIKAGPGRHKVATIERRLKALAWAHKHRDIESPTATQAIRSIMAAAKRAEAQQGIVVTRSRAITKPMLLKMIKKIDTRTLVGKRNRAFLAFGFFTGGRRRSEIASAEMRFLEKQSASYIYNLHHSKTDQLNRGALKILRAPYSRWLTAWIEAANIQDGFIFRAFGRNGAVSDKRMLDRTVNDVIKRLVEMIKENHALYSAHGLRRGWMTQCGRDGNISLGDAMAIGGWSDVRTAMKYYEEGKLHLNPATRI